MATQFETLHVRTDDLPAVKSALATAANLRREKTWRFRVASGAGWTSLYPELLYDPQQFARTLSSETGRLTVQIAGRDGPLWALHVAKGGKTVALVRSDKSSPSDITAAAEALASSGGAKKDALSDLLASREGAHSDRYRHLCRMLGIPAPQLSFADAGAAKPPLELVEFQLSQADPGPAPAEPALPPIDYSRQ